MKCYITRLNFLFSKSKYDLFLTLRTIILPKPNQVAFFTKPNQVDFFTKPNQVDFFTKPNQVVFLFINLKT